MPKLTNMMRFCQPEDYIYRGKNVWIHPAEITTIEPGSGNTSVITLRDGRKFTVKGRPSEIAEQLKEQA